MEATAQVRNLDYILSPDLPGKTPLFFSPLFLSPLSFSQPLFTACANPKCATCAGAGQTCTTCKDPTHVLQEGICDNQCSDGWFALNSVCTRCHTSCKTCNGASNQNCLTCDTAQFPYHDEITHECLTSCASGKFWNSTASTCTSCAIGCSICTSASPTSCTACKPNYYLHNNNECVDRCPSQFFTNTETNTCEGAIFLFPHLFTSFF